MKMTYQIKTAKLVPVFAARWRSICKHFIGSDNKQPKRMKRKNNKNMKKSPPVYIQQIDPKINSKRTKAKTFQVT